MRTTLDRLLKGCATAAVAAVAVAVVGSSASAQETSDVYVVHGIPDQPVDVYVNGDLTLEGFQPGEVAGPLALAAGSYDVVLTAPGDPESEALVSADGVQVPAGENLSLAAHLSEAGDPTLTPYVNDVSEVTAGQARLTVRHTAAAPAVDVRADGEALFSDLTNPNEDTTEVPAGTYQADVVLAGTDQVVIGPADLNLTEGSVTIVYAIGSADDDTLSLVVQVIDGMAGAPGEVPTGLGGLAAAGVGSWWYLLVVAGTLLLVGGTARYLTAPGTRAR
jgi:hypothetical protein